jgi:hypothetical protein
MITIEIKHNVIKNSFLRIKKGKLRRIKFNILSEALMKRFIQNFCSFVTIFILKLMTIFETDFKTKCKHSIKFICFVFENWLYFEKHNAFHVLKFLI